MGIKDWWNNMINDDTTEIQYDPLDSPPTPVDEVRKYGKIIKVSDEGYAFISSVEIPFTRIFMHWTSLNSDTIRFPELKVGMKVSFKTIEVKDKGIRAISVHVEN